MIAAIKKFITQHHNRLQMGKRGLTGSRKRRTQDDSLAAAADKSRPLNIAILAILWVFCSLVLCLPLDKATESLLVAHQQAPETIFAKFAFDYQDSEKTVLKRQKAIEKVPLYFRLNSVIENDCKLRIEQFFTAVKQRIIALQNNQQHKPPTEDKIDQLVANMDIAALQDFLFIIRDTSSKDNFIKNMKLVSNSGIMSSKKKKIYKVGQLVNITDSQNRSFKGKSIIDVQTPEVAAENITGKTLKFYSEPTKDVFAKIMVKVVVVLLGEQGNLEFDKQKTKEKRDAVAAITSPHIETIEKGQRIINRKQIVTEKLLKKLNIYNKLVAEQISSEAIFKHKLELISWCLVLMLVIGLYLHNVNPDIIKSNQKVLLTASTIIISLIINYSAVEVFSFFSTQFSLLPVLVLDVLPFALPAIVLSVTVGLRSAIYIGFFVAVLVAMMMNNSYNIVIEGLVISCFAGLAVRNATNYRSFFMRTTAVSFITAILLNFNLYLETLQVSDNIIPSLSIIAITSIVTAILGLVMIFIFELLFSDFHSYQPFIGIKHL